MKKLICILPLLCCVNCFGQTETKESFVNEVFKYFSHASDSYNYLLQNAGRIWNDMKGDSEYIGKLIPVEVTKKIFGRIAVDTLNEKWDCDLLIGAKCLDNISTIPEGSCYNFLSKPIFDDKYQYCIIKEGSFLKSFITRGGSCLWLFIKKNGKWGKLAVFDCEQH